MRYSNYHTHTLFCDGRDTPEELVAEALRLGCPEIGFSGHSYTAFDKSCCMSKEGTQRYRDCISALKEKYADSIKIYLGVEQDYYSQEPTDGYDYVIGSVHYVKKDGCFLCIDDTQEKLCRYVTQHYGGDFYALAEDYYKTVSDVYDKTKCDIIGHFDLITKFNEGDRLFDTSHPRYRKAAQGALDRLIKTPAAFEINTGAIARGYRSEPYPEAWITQQLRESGCRLVVTSDCHDKKNLLLGFEKAYALLGE